jgi:hypothetical protein
MKPTAMTRQALLTLYYHHCNIIVITIITIIISIINHPSPSQPFDKPVMKPTAMV